MPFVGCLHWKLFFSSCAFGLLVSISPVKGLRVKGTLSIKKTSCLYNLLNVNTMTLCTSDTQFLYRSITFSTSRILHFPPKFKKEGRFKFWRRQNSKSSQKQWFFWFGVFVVGKNHYKSMHDFSVESGFLSFF